MSVRVSVHSTRASIGLGLMTAAVCAASGCSDAGGPSATHDLSLSFATRLTTGSTASIARDASHTLVVTDIELVLSRLELAPTRVAACADVDGDSPGDGGGSGHDDGCEHLELASMVVDVPVDASVITALTVSVPSGTYRSLEARMRPLKSGRDTADAVLSAHPELAGASVRVVGTFDGQPFTYTGAPDAKLELAFNPPLTVTANTANITVHVDLDGWFRDASGNLIDPSTASIGGSNAATVADNIARSFDAFEDNDRRGEDPHDGNGTDGHGGNGGGNGDG